MRLDIQDGQVVVELDAIKQENFTISGKGHADTIRFLIKFYRDYQSIEKLITEKLQGLDWLIQSAVNRSMRKAGENFASFIFNFSKMKVDDDKTDDSSRRPD